MEFYVNHELLDIVIEDEKNAKDVVESFSKHIDSKLIMASININDTVYSPDDASLQSISVESIQKIDLELMSKDELAVELLNEIKQLFQNIVFDFKQNGYSHNREMKEPFLWIVNALKAIQQSIPFPLAEIKLINTTIIQIMDYISLEIKDDKKIVALCNIIENLLVFVDSLLFKIEKRYEISNSDLSKAIDDGLEILPQISESFQLGRDSEALANIQIIINLIETCTIYLKQNQELLQNNEVESLYEELNSLLSEIVEGFENSDFILIGDLMEYELPEKIQRFKSIIMGV